MARASKWSAAEAARQRRGCAEQFHGGLLDAGLAVIVHPLNYALGLAQAARRRRGCVSMRTRKVASHRDGAGRRRAHRFKALFVRATVCLACDALLGQSGAALWRRTSCPWLTISVATAPLAKTRKS